MSIFLDVKMIEDSISPKGARISTLQLEYPRYIHSELMAHRMFSRNAQSSRAIPVMRLIKRLYDHEVVPDPKDLHQNKKGMQAGEPLPIEEGICAHLAWKEARDNAVRSAEKLNTLGVHKQWVNRLLEPFSTITVLVTATEDCWPHFLALRDHPAAEPSFQKLAKEIRRALEESTPVERLFHLPYITIDERECGVNHTALMRISAARCARVSYVTHDGVRDLAADIALYNQLATAVPPHASPMEHPAAASHEPERRIANFQGWKSWRYLSENDSQRWSFRREDTREVLVLMDGLTDSCE